VTSKPGFAVTQGHRNDTIQSGTQDFLLTFHSNHMPILHDFRDKQRFPSKIANFSHPVYLTPQLKGFPLELDIGTRSQKSSNDGVTRWSKEF